MKKVIAFILSINLLVSAFAFTSCSAKNEPKETKSHTKKTEDIDSTTNKDIEEPEDTNEAATEATEVEAFGNGSYTYQVGDVNLSIGVNVYDYIDEDNRLHYADIFRDLGWEVEDGNIWHYDDLVFYFYIFRDTNSAVMKDVNYRSNNSASYSSVLIPNRDTYLSLSGDAYPIEGVVVAVFICEHLVDNPNVDPLEGILEAGPSGGYIVN